MESPRSHSNPQPTNNDRTCEQTKPSEQRRRRKEEQGANTTEFSRIITDPVTGKCYCRGKVLGKVRICISDRSLCNVLHCPWVYFMLCVSQGGFAKCYELTDLSAGKVFAAKIIPHARVAKPHQRDKVSAKRARPSASCHSPLLHVI